MRHLGKIVAVYGQVAEIQIAKSNQCAGCTACDMWDTQGPLRISAKNSVQAQMGDLVEVEIAPAQVIGSSLLVFLFPVVALMVGYWLGTRLAPELQISGEGAGILGALSFLVLSFGVIFLYDRLFLKKNNTKARIDCVVPQR
jgi:sigma-E factor negative regulatory protein RseC